MPPYQYCSDVKVFGKRKAPWHVEVSVKFELEAPTRAEVLKQKAAFLEEAKALAAKYGIDAKVFKALNG